MWTEQEILMILQGLWETVIIVGVSTFFGYILGMPLGVLLAVTDTDGIKPHPMLYKILDVITNVLRSVPFIILLVVLIPLTRAIVGKSYGTAATIVPLVIAAAPFIGRMVESSIKEVDHGVIEAAQSMGAGTFKIIWNVLLAEARTSLLVGVTIAFGTILGYSAMAGAVGGGGLGSIAIRYGYNRWQPNILWPCVIILVLLVQLFQYLGMKISRDLDRRRS
ncbi:MAG: ABC transporter permease [Lachnospiraceae bacterium]|nr:ABC transporter permease [Lachnospiraceae bacterium]